MKELDLCWKYENISNVTGKHVYKKIIWIEERIKA